MNNDANNNTEANFKLHLIGTAALLLVQTLLVSSLLYWYRGEQFQNVAVTGFFTFLAGFIFLVPEHADDMETKKSSAEFYVKFGIQIMLLVSGLLQINRIGVLSFMFVELDMSLKKFLLLSLFCCPILLGVVLKFIIVDDVERESMLENGKRIFAILTVTLLLIIPLRIFIPTWGHW